MKRRLLLEPGLRARLIGLADEARPVEACGALLGTTEDGITRVTDVIPLPNRSDQDHRSSFAIGPLDLFLASNQARPAGRAVVGIWHSHPRGPTGLSARDRRELPSGLSLVVVTPPGPSTSGTLRSFRRRLPRGCCPKPVGQVVPDLVT